jgi:hypothetical protein
VSQAETGVAPFPSGAEVTPWRAAADASEQNPTATAEQRMRRRFTRSLLEIRLPGGAFRRKAPPARIPVYVIRMLTPSVSSAEGAVDIATANDVATLVGITNVPEPI